jgi:hypothetical protein
MIPLEPLMRRMLDDQSLSATIAAKDSPVVKLRSESDVPGEGDIVALDAEFVSLAKEEAGEPDQALLASAAYELAVWKLRFDRY